MNAYYRLLPDIAGFPKFDLTIYYLLKLLKFCIWRDGCKSLTGTAKVTKGAGLSKGQLFKPQKKKIK